MIRALLCAVLASIAAGVLPACEGEPPGQCGVIDELRPATGSGLVVGAGALMTGASDQSVTITPDRQRMEYTFTIDGKRYTAVYALSEAQAPRSHRRVSLRRPPSSVECAALAQSGPLVDAIELRRNGRVLGGGLKPQLLPVSCSGRMVPEEGPEALGGVADGRGVPLGVNGFGWSLPHGLALLSGDQIAVTVLDGSAEPYIVQIHDEQGLADVEIGTLTGSGTLGVP